MDSHPLFRGIDKNSVEKLKKDFESKNGNKLKDFSIKEIVLMFHKDTKEEIHRCNEATSALERKLDKRIEWGEKTIAKSNKFMQEHDMLIQKLTDQLEYMSKELPEKGFCEEVTNALGLDKEVTLTDKVDIMWHDRRWIKRLLGILITLTAALGGGNILIQCV